MRDSFNAILNCLLLLVIPCSSHLPLVKVSMLAMA